MRIVAKSERIASAVLSVGVLFYSQIASAAFTLPLRSKKGMVVSAHPLASTAGISLLSKGGNAVDAAVATTFAISVVEPFSAGIGGGGFLLMHEKKTGEIKALDFRERAPLKASRDMYLDAEGKVRPNASVNGYLAVATPGTVAGLYEVHRRYGKLSWQEVVKPAIALAQDGFILSRRISPRSLQAYQGRKQTILQNPAARAIFTRNGEFYQPGERLVQRDLARTLTKISENPQSFYTGSIARAIASDMANNGGLITLEDLKAYKPIWRTPLCGNFRHAKICSMPPPSSGGVHLLQILNIIGDSNLKSWGWHHPDALHLMVEAMKIAYADRSQYLGDPDFVKVPVQELISPAYAKIRRQQINMEVAKPSTEVKPVDLQTLQRLTSNLVDYPQFSQHPTPLPPSPQARRGELEAPLVDDSLSLQPARRGELYQNCDRRFVGAQGLAPLHIGVGVGFYTPRYESPETSHLTVVDEQRNAISLTFTINLGFGAGVVTPGTGIVLNNEMDDFSIAPGVPNAFKLVGNEANSIAPPQNSLIQHDSDHCHPKWSLTHGNRYPWW